MLADFFGESALIKILDFLLDEWEMDFSQADIARETGLNWKTVHLLMPRLERAGLVRRTRVINRAKMYAVGRDSEAFRAVKKLDACVNAAILKRAAQGVAIVAASARRK